VSLKPGDGANHQCVRNMAHIAIRSSGDPKYFPRRIGNCRRLRTGCILRPDRIVVPHPRGGTIDVTAAAAAAHAAIVHLLGFTVERYDPIVDAPEA